MKRRKSLIASAVALAVLAAGLTATAISAKPTKRSAGSIEVLSLWGGSEKDAFLKVTDAFTKATGIKVNYTSARDFIPEIRTRLAAGNPPEIGILPRPGYITTLAKQGALKPLSTLGLSNAYMSGNYSAGWLKLGSSGGKLYGVRIDSLEARRHGHGIEADVHLDVTCSRRSASTGSKNEAAFSSAVVSLRMSPGRLP